MDQRIWPLIKRTFELWRHHAAMRLAASVAFYTMMALAPLVVVALRILSLRYGNNVEDAVGREVSVFLGPDESEDPGSAIRQILHMVAQTHHGYLASWIGFGVAIVSGSTLFVSLQDALNIMWDVKSRRGMGLRIFLRNRLAAAAMVLAAVVLMIMSFAFSAALSVIVQHLGRIGWGWGMPYLADTAASFVIALLMFAVIFKILPDVRTTWADVGFGAAVTATLFILGKFALTLYFRIAAVQDPYGAAGSLAALLIWVYYSAALMFLGAAFTRAHAEFRGRAVIPTRYAVRIRMEDDESVGVTS